MAVPAYVDRDLLATVLVLARFPPDRVARILEQSGGNAAVAVGAMRSSQDKRERTLAKAMEDYFSTLGTENLQKLLVAAGMGEDLVIRSINAAQGGRVATPTLRAVVDRLGRGQEVTSTLRTVGAGETALDTTRTQYKEGKRPAAPGVPAGGSGEFRGVGATGAWEAPAPGAAAAQVATPMPGPTGVGGGTTRQAGRPVPRPVAAPAPAPTTVVDPQTLGKSIDKLRRDAPPAEARQWIAEHMGYAAWMMDDPQVFDVLTRAAKEGWNDARLQGGLARTTLFQTTNISARNWRDKVEKDPGQAADERSDRTRDVTEGARSLGFDISPDRARQIAEDSLRFGWDDRQLQMAVGHEYRYDPQRGLVGVTKQIGDLAREWGVPLSETSRNEWGKRLAGGDLSIEELSQVFVNQAKGLYPHLAPDFDRGISLKLLADPYLETAARTLDLDAATLDLNDPRWMRALNTIDPKTGSTARMSQYDWANTLKTDAVYGWDKTAQGREHGAKLAGSLSQLFGR